MTQIVESPAARMLRSEARALADDRFARAVEDFLATHLAFQKALSTLTAAQASGPDPVPADVESLHGEAQQCWDLLATGWAENLLPSEVRQAGREYARPKVVQEPVEMNWSALDWSRSRGSA